MDEDYKLPFREYALTLQKSRGPMTEETYSRILDRMEQDLHVLISRRCFEIGKRMGRLHVHCTVSQLAEEEPITPERMRAYLPKVYRHNMDFGEITDKKAWEKYIMKDQKYIPDPEEDIPIPKRRLF